MVCPSCFPMLKLATPCHWGCDERAADISMGEESSDSIEKSEKWLVFTLVILFFFMFGHWILIVLYMDAKSTVSTIKILVC